MTSKQGKHVEMDQEFIPKHNEKKERSKKQYLFIGIFLLSLATLIIASEFQPEGSGPVGYEYYNDTLHIWNENADYYFNATSGIQITNVPDEYWSHNVFCGGVKISDAWQYSCTDELDFTWNLQSDNETFVNVTGHKDITKNVGGNDYTIRYALVYGLRNNYTHLNVTTYEKNIGALDIPLDTGFGWIIKDINIGGDEENDYIELDDYYDLNETLNIQFNNLTEGRIYLGDFVNSKSIEILFDNTLNYQINVSSNEQYNAPVKLLINAGTLSVGQSKQTTFNWIDAECSWSCDLIDPTTPDEYEQGSSFTQDGEIGYIGSCSTSGATIQANHNGTKTLASGTGLTTSGTNPQSVSCGAGLCTTLGGGWTIDADEVGIYNISNYCGFNRQGKGSGYEVITIIEPAPVETCNYFDVTSNHVFTEHNWTCFNISSNNIVFDCAGYNSYAENSGQINDNWTIITDNVENITIRNCMFSNWTRVINLRDTNHSTLENLTLWNTTDIGAGEVRTYGIKLDISNNNTLTWINVSRMFTFSTTSSHCDEGDINGIDFFDSDNNTLQNSFLFHINGSNEYDTIEGGGCNPGILQVGTGIDINGSFNIIYNNSFYITGKDGVYTDVDGGTNVSSNFFNKTQTSINIRSTATIPGWIHNNVVLNPSVGIHDGDDDWNITNNCVDFATNEGITFDPTGGSGGVFKHNVVRHMNGSTGSGIYMEVLTVYDVLDNITIFNYTNPSVDTEYAFWARAIQEENFTRINISNSTHGLKVQSDDNDFYDSNFETSNISIFLASSGFTDNNFINVTFNESQTSVSASCNMDVWNYLTINVTNDSLKGEPNVQINISNSSGQQSITFTDADGLNESLIIHRFFEDDGGRYYDTPYNITINKTGYIMNSSTTHLNSSEHIWMSMYFTPTACWSLDADGLLWRPNGCLYNAVELYQID